MKCKCCGTDPLELRETDNNQIQACTVCGVVYNIEGRKPTIVVKNLKGHREYWNRFAMNCCPGAYNMGGSPNEVATQHEIEHFKAYVKAHPHEFGGEE